MQANSLQRRLLQWLLLPLIVILLLGSVIAYRFSLQAAMNAADLGLLDSAFDLSKQVEINSAGMLINLPPAAQQMLQANNQDHVTYAAWDDEGKMFSGNRALLAYGELPTHENYAFRDVVVGGQNHREVLLRSRVGDKDFYIAVAQTTHGRTQLTDGILASILLPEILLAGVSVLVVWLGVRRGLAPVQLLRNEIASRSSADLSPIEETSAPTELAPIIHGINELFATLSSAFVSQRRFIADAAHQLRTPLASLSSQIEVGLEQPAVDGKVLLKQLLLTTQRTTHLANQLLSLARLEHTERSMYQADTVALQMVVSDASADIVILASKKGVDFDFDLQPCQVSGSPLMLRELLVNLLDNAVRYTPAGGRVTVQLYAEAASVLLSVADTGCGVPDNELSRIGTPFHRLPNSQPDGCGLGLAIAKEIARLHGAEMLFASGGEGGGFQVQVRFAAVTGLR